jgi:lipopolysaccharide transport system ATP-binding protein
MEPVIQVEHLSKSYVLKHQAGPVYSTLRDSISDAALSMVGKGKTIRSNEVFWALDDVNFQVNQGERLGIIGRNGAGKSTLLKLLSRITSPTKGRITIDGRVASLLEVGTGFHPELSGRENIFLNGSVLGMSRAEIKRKFDEIVAFAEVEKFLDTPVKRYSSGMYVRLAFAVSAHLEPEILIVDEVLAVGDASFQKKCLGKMKDVAGQGRTVLFVSHNMAAIQNLCDKCLYLKNGTAVSYGSKEDVIPLYLRSTQASRLYDLTLRQDRMGDGAIRFKSFTLKDQAGNSLMNAQCGSPLRIVLEFEQAPSRSLRMLQIAIGVDDEYGNRVTHFSNESTGQIFEDVQSINQTVEIEIPVLPLKKGDYTLALFSSVNGNVADWIQEAAVITVEAGDFYHTGKLPEDSQGSMYVNHSWKLR